MSELRDSINKLIEKTLTMEKKSSSDKGGNYGLTVGGGNSGLNTSDVPNSTLSERGRGGQGGKERFSGEQHSAPRKKAKISLLLKNLS